MKHIILFLMTLSTLMAFEYSQQLSHWVYWDPGSTNTDSTMKIVVNNSQILADSAGTWKRIDNSVDSCSYPFWINDSSQAVNPETEMQIFQQIVSDEIDSNQIHYNIETRERYRVQVYGNYYDWKWSEWVHFGKENGLAVVDSFSTEATDFASVVTQKNRFDVTGLQARLCATIPAYASAEAIDTTYYDSLLFIRR